MARYSVLKTNQNASSELRDGTFALLGAISGSGMCEMSMSRDKGLMSVETETIYSPSGEQPPFVRNGGSDLYAVATTASADRLQLAVCEGVLNFKRL